MYMYICLLACLLVCLIVCLLVFLKLIRMIIWMYLSINHTVFQTHKSSTSQAEACTYILA